jgi:hypothetical protein
VAVTPVEAGGRIADHQAGAVHAMLDEVLAWAFALRPLRVGPGA